MTNTLGVAAVALRDIGLRDAGDPEIFEAAKAQGVILMTTLDRAIEFLDVKVYIPALESETFPENVKKNVKKSNKFRV